MSNEHEPSKELRLTASPDLTLLLVTDVATRVHNLWWPDRDFFDGKIYTLRSSQNNIYQACIYRKPSSTHVRFSRLRWNKNYETSVTYGLIEAIAPDLPWIQVFPKESDFIDEENTYHIFAILPDSPLKTLIPALSTLPKQKVWEYQWADWYRTTRWKCENGDHPDLSSVEILEISPPQKDSKIFDYTKILNIKNAIWWRGSSAFQIIENDKNGTIYLIKWTRITSRQDFPNLKNRKL